MIECRNCRGYFRASPEKIGARCPKCKAPLFERPEKPTRDADFGACGLHPGVHAIASCRRCTRSLCSACRTRWHGEVLCTSCVELSLSRAEPNPRELRQQAGRAVWSLTLACVGWVIALCAAAFLGKLTAAIVFAILSLVPALFAVGYGTPVLLARGPRFNVAASGMIMASLQLGLLLGVLLINLWHN